MTVDIIMSNGGTYGRIGKINNEPVSMGLIAQVIATEKWIQITPNSNDHYNTAVIQMSMISGFNITSCSPTEDCIYRRHEVCKI